MLGIIQGRYKTQGLWNQLKSFGRDIPIRVLLSQTALFDFFYD